MKLCITEKPSVARDIASILGANSRHDGYYEGNGYFISWTFGHLCCLKEPHDYSDAWKRWSLGALPMLPARFGIKLIDQDSIKRQFRVIESLAGQVSEIINCGDAGQEGELIQRWVMQLAGVGCEVKRLWISSLTDESIREGFANLRPQTEFDNLYFAGLSRAIGDWILGMNATRLYSLKYSSRGNVLSIGRVQTPTLAIVVGRQNEIDNFKPADFWELKTLYRDVTFSAVKGRFDTEHDAQTALEEIRSIPLTITDVQTKTGRESPPRLFDLTSLQVECNRRWGWSADMSLKLIQSLYEKKVTTYPRVDTTYLTEDIYPKIPTILRQMTPYANLTACLLEGKIPKTKKVFDNSKVTDHHAIIPTGQSPSVLQGDERKLYHLIALRFITAFYPDCRFKSTTVMAKVGKVEFKTIGKIITDLGWRVVDQSKQADDTDDDRILPPFEIGESGSHEPALVKKTTQPPKPFTEGTLLRAMEGAGKSVDDEVLREALKINGIGRPSTRAAIIETLFKRRYIQRTGKSIVPTQAGKDLIATIKDPLLKSAKLTGLWEHKLRLIERGQYSASEFVAELKTMIGEIVVGVLSDNSGNWIEVPSAEEKKTKPAASEKKVRITKFEQIACPACGKGHIVKGRTAFGCSNHAQGCKMLLGFDNYPADLTPGKLNKLIQKLKK